MATMSSPFALHERYEIQKFVYTLRGQDTAAKTILTNPHRNLPNSCGGLDYPKRKGPAANPSGAGHL
jgi:hypothetical protein